MRNLFASCHDTVISMPKDCNCLIKFNKWFNETHNHKRDKQSLKGMRCVLTNQCLLNMVMTNDVTQYGLFCQTDSLICPLKQVEWIRHLSEIHSVCKRDWLNIVGLLGCHVILYAMFQGGPQFFHTFYFCLL